MSICTFCGHHDAPDSIRTMLLPAIEKMIVENKVNIFYVVNHGNFDHMALSSLKEMRKEYPQISYYVVLAYMPEKKDESPLYESDETILPDGIGTHFRGFAISFRYEWMVE